MKRTLRPSSVGTTVLAQDWNHRAEKKVEEFSSFTFFNQTKEQMTKTVYIYRRKRYGFFNFIWDVFMVCITAGFWLIWIFVREMRKP